MNDFNIIILNKELTDEYGALNENLILDQDNTYLSFEISNIPRILSKIIIDKKILIPMKSSDMDKIKMIYFSSLKEYQNLLKFLEKNISKMPLSNDNEINLLKYMEEFHSLSSELNLNRVKSKNKKALSLFCISFVKKTFYDLYLIYI